MSPPRRPPFSQPRMTGLAIGAGAVLFLCVVALAETGDVWIGVLTVIALGAMAVAIIIDLRHVIAADEPRPAAPQPPPGAPEGGAGSRDRAVQGADERRASPGRGGPGAPVDHGRSARGL